MRYSRMQHHFRWCSFSHVGPNSQPFKCMCGLQRLAFIRAGTAPGDGPSEADEQRVPPHAQGPADLHAEQPGPSCDAPSPLSCSASMCLYSFASLSPPSQLSGIPHVVNQIEAGGLQFCQSDLQCRDGVPAQRSSAFSCVLLIRCFACRDQASRERTTAASILMQRPSRRTVVHHGTCPV